MLWALLAAIGTAIITAFGWLRSSRKRAFEHGVTSTVNAQREADDEALREYVETENAIDEELQKELMELASRKAERERKAASDKELVEAMRWVTDHSRGDTD